MNVISEIQRINAIELTNGLTHTPASWHQKYASSAWINIGSLPLNLTEGDVICIFSQYGEIEDIHLVRDGDSGKSRGFAFVKYEDARSCVLAVDNLCGCQVLGRQLRVDHVEKYRLPKHVQEREERNEVEADNNNNDNNSSAAVAVAEAGHAYKGQELASEYDIHTGQDLFAAPSQKRQQQQHDVEQEDDNHNPRKEELQTNNSKEERKRRKEERAQKRKEKEEHRRRKEDRKRRKHSTSHHGKDKRRRRSRSRSHS